MAEKEKPQYSVTINVFADGRSELIPSANNLSPDAVIDLLDQHSRLIERNIIVADVVAVMNAKKNLPYGSYYLVGISWITSCMFQKGFKVSAKWLKKELGF